MGTLKVVWKERKGRKTVHLNKKNNAGQRRGEMDRLLRFQLTTLREKGEEHPKNHFSGGLECLIEI